MVDSAGHLEEAGRVSPLLHIVSRRFCTKTFAETFILAVFPFLGREKRG